jgi:tetratricopeptide (TPR) repeat protein
METYEKLILIPSLEPSLLKSTTYTLAQLYTVEENYPKALNTIENWFKLEENPRPDAYILKAQILYQLERFPQMIEPVETAIRVAGERDLEVKEEWYSLLNYAYFQMENYAKVRDIQKILLQTWPRKRYWISLAGALTELGEDRKLVNAYDAAYTQGMLEDESELVTMAQLFMQREVPYKAAKVLDQYMADGTVSETERNYRLLAQAWMLSREDQKAIPALQKAANMAEDGEIDIRLANAYLNIGEYSDCAEWARSAIRKGGLRTPGNAQISLGMCLYNLRQYGDSRNAFREAAKTASLRRQANQWIAVIDADVERNEQIRLAEQEARRKQEEVEKRRAKSTRI